MNDFDLNGLLNLIKKLNKQVEKIKIADYEVESKLDASPLTKADIYVNKNLCNFVETTNCKNIISEEISNLDYKVRRKWKKYWVIDPIDGTKEFIKKSTDYTINIALCEGDEPIFGLVSCPANNDIYYAFKNKGAFLNNAKIATSKGSQNKIKRVVSSKSHMNEDTANYIEGLRKNFDIELKNYGSSLKICKVAEGEADIYPRFGPTMEWDTCAAQIILEEAGGKFTSVDGKRVIYNKENLLNPFFIVEA